MQKYWEFGLVNSYISYFIALAALNFLMLTFPTLVFWYLIHKKHFRLKWALAVLVFLSTSALVPSLFYSHMGYPWLWSGTQIFQFADTLGASGLGLFTYLSNAFWIYFLSFDLKNRKLKVMALRLYIVVLISLHFVGHLYGVKQSEESKAPSSPLKIALIQTNHFHFKYYADQNPEGFRLQILEDYLLLSQKAIDQAQPELLFWPESALPFDLSKESKESKKLLEFINASPAEIFLGGYFTPEGTDLLQNAVYLLSATEWSVYSKNILIPFVEYNPLEKYFKIQDSKHPFFTAGVNPPILDAKSTRFGLSICFEALYPEHFQRQADLGAQAFVNVSNDYWFDSLLEKYQHFYISMARSIEYRRPLIRSTKTGLTGVVNAHGEIEKTVSPDSIGVQVSSVQLSQGGHRTFYQKYRSYVNASWLCLSLVFLILGAKDSSSRRGHS